MSEDRFALFDRETGEIVHATYRRSDQMGELFAALAKAQGAFKSAERAGENPHFRSRYATLESVVDATREPLSQNALAIIQFPCNVGNAVGVTTILGHASGQWLEHTFSVVPVKFDAQGAGSAITYLRRYGRMSVCGIAAEDDDGNAAVAPGAAPRHNGPAATRANPAPASAAEDAPRRAYKALQQAIDTSEDADALREVYDAVLDAWGGMFAKEVEVIRETHPSALELLKTRLQTRLQQIGADR